jgi:hypothetical protein
VRHSRPSASVAMTPRPEGCTSGAPIASARRRITTLIAGWDFEERYADFWLEAKSNQAHGKGCVDVQFATSLPLNAIRRRGHLR